MGRFFFNAWMGAALAGALVISPIGSGQGVDEPWPSDGPTGQLGGGWQSVGHASHDPTTFGIASRPIGPFAVVTLENGRPAVVYEAVQGAVRTEAALVLRVRTLADNRWVDAADPLRLRDLEPGEVREQRWGSQIYLDGPGAFDQIRARRAPEGGLQVVALEAAPRDRLGNIIENRRVIHRHLWRDGAWQASDSFPVQMPGEPLGDVAGPRIELSAYGSVYFLEGRRVAGQATACVRQRDGSRWVAMDYQVPGDGRGVSGMRDLRLFVDGPEPLLATTGQQVHDGRVIHGDVVLRWTGAQWRPRFDDPQMQAKVRRYGIPAAQRPDGMPVWVYTTPAERSRSNPLGEQVRFVEPAGEAGFVEQRLPDFAVQATTRIEVTPDVRYVGGQPVVTLAGLAATDDRRRDAPLNRLCVAVYERAGENWKNVGRGASPAYARPLHDATDRVHRAVARLDREGTLLLWQGPAPIGGPPALYAARYAGATGRDGDRNAAAEAQARRR